MKDTKTTEPESLDNTKQMNFYFRKPCLVYLSLTQAKRKTKSPKRSTISNRNPPYSESSEIRIIAGFSSEIIQARKDQKALFDCWTKHFPI